MSVRFCDETEFGFGWIAAEPAYMLRASHAVRSGNGVWLVEPVDGELVEESVRALGKPAGVVQLLDRHERDGPALAERLGVPLHRVPFGGVPQAPFEVVPVLRAPGWKEVALWFRDERTLICADALGTAPYYLAAGERLAVHPLLRLRPPAALRDLAGRVTARHVLCGHGEGIHGEDASLALREAVTTAQRRIPAFVRARLRRRR